ncbi:MAG: bifunctional UDP-N-acetylglucosamine diphosphorylase/glucosamine-1-phosphate N-acetyltransferase GlmU [Bacillota bacterium]
MLTGIILAAGKGTRMKSSLPKVLHKVAGKTMLDHVIDSLESVDCNKSMVVIGHKKEMVKNEVNRKVNYVIQDKQLGTGHAVMMCQNQLPDNGDVLIVYGDTPLLTSNTLNEFVKNHKDNGNVISVLSAKVDNPFGYGRIIKDSKGNLVKIVEQKDASDKEKKVNEINSGIYCIKAIDLKKGLDKLDNNNSQNEYYLTDLVSILKSENKKVGSYIIDDNKEITGVNTRKDLFNVQKIFTKRILDKHMENGVTIQSSNVFIGKDVKIGQDSIILPGVYLTGKTSIGKNCIIGPNTTINNSKISNNVEVKNSTVINSEVENSSKIGPYAYLRPNSKIGKEVKIGDFVEVKNTSVGDGSKVSHLSYIGDGEIGKNVNIGCGVVFVNYNGKEKFKTKVGDDSFVGCNSNLVAPVTIHNKGYVAAGSTITQDVPSEALSIARKKQENKLNWVKNSGLLD